MNNKIKKIISVLLTIILLPVTSILSKNNAKGETKGNDTSASVLDEIDSEMLAKALEYLEWVENGIYYKLSAAYTQILISKIDRIPMLILSIKDPELKPIDTYDEGGISTGKGEAYVFYEFDPSASQLNNDFNPDRLISKKQILSYARDKHYIDKSEEYFDNNQEVEYEDSISLEKVINGLDISEEERNKIFDKLENGITLSELVVIMMKYDSTLEHWHTKVKPKILLSKLNVSAEKFAELSTQNIKQSAMRFLISKSDAGEIKVTFFVAYKSKNGESGYIDIKTGLRISGINFEKPESYFLKQLGVKKLTEKNKIYFGPLYNAADSSYFPQLTSYLREAEVTIDGEEYYNMAKLFIAYSMLNPDNQLDYSWYIEPNTIGRRNTGYDILSEKNADNSYILRSVPKNYNYETRIGKNNRTELPERKRIAKNIPTAIRDYYYISGFNSDTRYVYFQRLPIGKLKIVETENEENSKIEDEHSKTKSLNG